MLEKTLINHFTIIPLRSASGISPLLDALDSDPRFIPTNWGPNEHAREEYDRAAVTTAVDLFKSDTYVVGLRRTRPPKYAGFVMPRLECPSELEIEFGKNLSPHLLPNAIALADRLADAMRPEFGFVHPIAPEHPDGFASSAISRLRDFLDFGPGAISAVTWFGPQLVKLIGRELLQDCGAARAIDTSWGGVRIDLVDGWDGAQIARLPERQGEVMANLASAEVFADYSAPIEYKRGKRFDLRY